MRSQLWIVALALFVTVPALAQSPPFYSTAKPMLSEIHEEIGHLQTLYCGCPYERDGESGDIDREACNLKTRANDERSARIQFEHVVPAQWFGGHRPCWKGDHDLCLKKEGADKGERSKRRKCCDKVGVDPEFRVINGDPHNLFPASGEVNFDRLHHPYGTVPGEDRLYGACDFEVGGSPKVAEPAKCVRGELARAMLYMIDQHGVTIKGMTRDQLLAWHKADPPEDWERRRAHRIEARTGLRNPYIGPP